MKINYDKSANAVYIQIKKGKISKTVEVSKSVVHDIDKDGNVLGIEILNASKLFSLKDLENNVIAGIPLNITYSTPVSA